jgi:aryl-alcohol dehydrogenase-like predicted oxidoreductase
MLMWYFNCFFTCSLESKSVVTLHPNHFDMEKRPFGKTGIDVSILGFGAGHIGSPKMEEKTVELLLNKMLDLGINLVDTARAYGLSEQRIGKYISHRRKDYFLSTKVGYDVEWKPDWTYDAVYYGIDQALVLLKTDYLDIVHLHSCSREILQQGDVIMALEKAKLEGKIRFMAYSGENDALEYALETGKFDSIQTSVNICDQRGITRYLPKAIHSGLGVIAKRPIANAPWRHETPPVGHYSAEYWHRLKKMDLDTGKNNIADVAIRFTAFTPGVSSCILGTSKQEHIKEGILSIEKGPLAEEMTDYLGKKFHENDDGWEGLI